MLLFFDGFELSKTVSGEGYDTTLSSGYSASPWDCSEIYYNSSSVTGRDGIGKALQFNGGSSGTEAGLRKIIPPSTTVICGFGFKISAPDSAASRVVRFLHSPAQLHCSLLIYPDGKLGMADAAGTPYGSPTAGNVTLANDTWYYIEVKVEISASGSFEVRVDGVTDSAATGVDTLGGTVAECNVVTLGTNVAWYPQTATFDDVYICDDTGTENNDFLGPCRVVTLAPVSDEDASEWTGSDGNSTNNYALVDEQQNDADTTYVRSTAAGQMDCYAMPNLPHYPTSIFGVRVAAVSVLHDVAEGPYRAFLRYAATDFPLPQFVASGAYIERIAQYDADFVSGSPETPWTRNVINALSLGLESL